MSYCRWSSDDHQCDVYAYESPQGIEVHIASRRRVITEPLPTLSILELADIDFDQARAGVEPHASRLADFLAQSRRRSEILEAQELVALDSPFAGESRTFDEPGAAADWLIEIAGAGVRFPKSVVDVLREEQAELEAAGTGTSSTHL